MARVRQYYEAAGAPMRVPGEPAAVVAAWRSHRRRFRGWFADLDAQAWSGSTRCSEWQVRDIAQHLVSGAQFLGYTLHQSGKGEATRLLADFDAQQTPKSTTAVFDALSPAELLAQLAAMDARVDQALDRLADQDWRAAAEAPPGRVPGFVAVNHFLFDSWVHERDVMLPAGQTPEPDPDEAPLVVSYVLAMAGAAGFVGDPAPEPVSLRVRLTDLGEDLLVDRRDGITSVTIGTSPGRPDLSGTSGDVVDVATGRVGVHAVDADAASGDFLTHLAQVMA